MKLSVNIPTDLNRSPQLQQHRLIQQQIPHFTTQRRSIGLGDIDRSSGLLVPCGQHSGDDAVDPLIFRTAAAVVRVRAHFCSEGFFVIIQGV